MGRWDTLATDLLAAAEGSGVVVARSFVAPSSNYAKRCRLLAVHSTGTREIPAPGDFGMPCATITRLGFVVTFVADCYPGPLENGDPAPAADVTAWTVAWLADSEAVHSSLLSDWWSDDSIDCDAVSVGDGETFGPTGGHARMSWPVGVLLT
jgi:hypothetical protein